MIAFLSAGIVVGLIGSTTIIPGTELAAAWPSAGIAVLWFLVRRAAVVGGVTEAGNNGVVYIGHFVHLPFG